MVELLEQMNPLRFMDWALERYCGKKGWVCKVLHLTTFVLVFAVWDEHEGKWHTLHWLFCRF